MKNEDDIRQDCGMAVSEIVQLAIAAVLRKRGKEGVPDASYIGCNAALCALVPSSALFVKKPPMTEEQIERDGAKVLSKLLCYETILFTALVCARMHQGLKVENAGRHTKDGISFEIVGEVNFGPDVLSDALQDWKKLTGKEPIDYFDTGLIRGLEELNSGAVIPLSEFLEKRKKATPTSSTLQ